MTTEMNNNFTGELLKGLIDCDGHSWILILMATAFTYDKDADDGYANVSAEELGAGNGYAQKTKALANPVIAVDDTNDRSDCSWDDVVWTASGGNIGPSPGAIPLDDTHASDALAGYIDFGGDQTATDGGTFTVANPTIRLTT